MAGSNEFLPFAIGVGANVLSQAAYAALAARTAGFAAGIAESAELNKAWRQSGFGVAALAQWMANVTGNDVLDDGDIDEFIATLAAAVQAQAATPPIRIITASANVVLSVADAVVGFNRTVGPAATQATLPTLADGAAGRLITIDDLASNAGTYNITVIPPAGAISGLARFVFDEDGQSAAFRWFGSNTWGLEAK